MMEIHLQIENFNAGIKLSFLQFEYWKAIFYQLNACQNCWTISKPYFELKTGGVVNKDNRGNKQSTKELQAIWFQSRDEQGKENRIILL